MLLSSFNMINHTINLDLTSSFDKLINTFSSESIIHTLANGSTIDVIVGLMLLFSYIMWLFSYQMGLSLNLRYSRIGWIQRVILHLQTLILSVLIGLLETFPSFWAMLEYYFRSRINKTEAIHDFYVISK
jgi:hypothetical protein